MEKDKALQLPSDQPTYSNRTVNYIMIHIHTHLIAPLPTLYKDYYILTQQVIYQKNQALHDVNQLLFRVLLVMYSWLFLLCNEWQIQHYLVLLQQ